VKSVERTLKEMLSTLVSGMGYEFVGCEMHGQGRQTVLRIYIDTPNGVTVDDCSNVSRQVSAMLDVEDPIPGQYTLEVSSPGIDRPLFEITQFEKYVGSRVKIRMRIPVENQRNFVGKLISVKQMDIHLLTDLGEVVLPFSNIEKAKLLADTH
jgi:ribosome maturation factor RimP